MTPFFSVFVRNPGLAKPRPLSITLKVVTHEHLSLSKLVTTPSTSVVREGEILMKNFCGVGQKIDLVETAKQNLLPLR